MTINVPERLATARGELEDLRNKVADPVTRNLLAAMVVLIVPEMSVKTADWVRLVLWDRADYVANDGQKDYAWEMHSVAGRLSDVFGDYPGCDGLAE